ncbi:2-oxo-4-hydroxy-4-carboxy-5-ureidoimidazoline decarboxylase [Neokomagataea tanensis]|uniref:2-oxo-4-hydroxy-4-carboxy-5-ureidoimidazoline decarboxylase n=2 Tax=Neokomagataea TaxID=1223423 RepID=A0A4Y6V971_9PROT|nr:MULTISPECIES: 2-oxo-4-hydroxy-4-carboxy-5-ureidoimidazoline decarboxylase [Neokomagataea]QDH25448.1 2-oxo-4-hydroxy-4-carboxy-5-ureidoimidazoline decarboxylase [Neokomagataea tanensis]
MGRLSLSQINGLPEKDFVEFFGGIYEHSPWVAKDVVSLRPFSSFDSLKQAFAEAVGSISEERKLLLVREHPELGQKVGVVSKLTPESAKEQGDAGLDRLSEEEFAHFNALNNAYADKFEMPFVICVRQANKDIILAEMSKRLENSPADELKTALAHIDQIASLRLQDKFLT